MAGAIGRVVPGYSPEQLIASGIALLVFGLLVLVFSRSITRLRARGWPGNRHSLEVNRVLVRAAGVGLLIAGAVCLVIVVVRALGL